jgi:hypothetical protein
VGYEQDWYQWAEAIGSFNDPWKAYFAKIQPDWSLGFLEIGNLAL